MVASDELCGRGKDRFTILTKEVNRKYKVSGVYTQSVRIFELEQAVFRVGATQWSAWLPGLSLIT